MSNGVTKGSPVASWFEFEGGGVPNQGKQTRIRSPPNVPGDPLKCLVFMYGTGKTFLESGPPFVLAFKGKVAVSRSHSF